MRWPQCRWVDNGYRIGGDLRDRRFGINFIPCSKCWSEVARALKHDPGLHTIYDPTRLLRLVVAKTSPCGPGCTMAPKFPYLQRVAQPDTPLRTQRPRAGSRRAIAIWDAARHSPSDGE